MYACGIEQEVVEPGHYVQLIVGDVDCAIFL